MKVFVDTSGFYALLDKGDENYSKARKFWLYLIEKEQLLVSSSYVLSETNALVQRRLGMDIVMAFENNVAPMLEVEWVDYPLHQSGVAAMLAANRRQLSLVDCVSFEVCRKLGIKDVFAFDKHFGEQGFNLLKT